MTLNERITAVVAHIFSVRDDCSAELAATAQVALVANEQAVSYLRERDEARAALVEERMRNLNDQIAEQAREALEQAQRDLTAARGALLNTERLHVERCEEVRQAMRERDEARLDLQRADETLDKAGVPRRDNAPEAVLLSGGDPTLTVAGRIQDLVRMLEAAVRERDEARARAYAPGIAQLAQAREEQREANKEHEIAIRERCAREAVAYIKRNWWKSPSQVFEAVVTIDLATIPNAPLDTTPYADRVAKLEAALHLCMKVVRCNRCGLSITAHSSAGAAIEEALKR